MRKFIHLIHFTIFLMKDKKLCAKKGLIYIKGQIFPTSKERIIKFPIPVSKTFICQLPDLNILENPAFGNHIDLEIQQTQLHLVQVLLL